MRVLSLCSGIGALDLGLERAGLTIVGQVERDPYCQRVLARHWPEVPRHDDVTTTPTWWTSQPGRPVVDVVAAGFPCQPASLAGDRRGTDDERWLWPEVFEVVTAVRPPWVLLENVPGLLSLRPDRDGGLGDDPVEPVVFGTVLGDLAAGGYDARWDCIPASAVGAPHRRDRIWVLGHLAHSDCTGRDPRSWQDRPWPTPVRDRWWTPQPRLGRTAHGPTHRLDPTRPVDPWERDTPRLANGVPDQVARLHGLGNAVVPQVAEHLGRVVLDLASDQVGSEKSIVIWPGGGSSS